MSDDVNVWGIVEDANAFMRGKLPRIKQPRNNEEVQRMTVRGKSLIKTVEVVRKSCGRFIKETIEI